MNRYLFVLGVFSAIATALLYLLGISALLIIAGSLVLLIVILFLFRKRICEVKTIAVLSAVSLLFLVYYGLFYNLNVSPVIKLNGTTGVIEGYVCEEPTQSGGMYKYDIKVTSFSDKNAKQNFKIRVKLFGGAKIDVFDKVKAKVSFYPVKKQYKRAMFSDGIYIDAEVNNLEKNSSVQKSLYGSAIQLRRSIRSTINNSFNKENAGLLCALVIGDRSQLSEKINKDLVNCGIVHIIAISGMHISIVCMTFMNLLIKITKNLRLSALLTIPLVVFFIAVTGFTPSAMRAGIMFIIMTIGVLIFRKEDPINSLGGAVVIMLFVNPFLICDLSFLLSVVSVFGILVFTNKIQSFLMRPFNKSNALKRVFYYPTATVAMSISATISTLPITAIWLGYISNVAVAANLLVIFAANYGLITCLIGLALSSFGLTQVIAAPVFAATKLMTNYLRFVAQNLAKIPFALSCVGFRYFLIWIVAALLLIAFCLIMYKERLRIRFVSLICIFMLLVSAVTWKVVDRNVVELAVIGDGSGFCCVIRKNNNCVLIGCLSEYDERTFISNYLLSRGIDNPDVIIMPTALDNVAGGFRSVVDFYKCDTVVAPLNRLTDDIKKSSVDFEMCELENALMTFYNDITVRSVPNEYGCALVVKHGNKTCLISSCSGNYEDYCEKIGGVDLIITPPVITTGVAINSTTKMVFAGDSERSGEIINKLNLENNKVVLTDGNRVIARFKGTSDIKIIRE